MDSNCRPMVGNFVSIVEGGYSSIVEDDLKSGKKFSDIYHPLQMNPVFYDQEPAPKRISRERRRAAKVILNDTDLKEEEDRPVEVYYGSSISDTRFLNKMREKDKYEEENFTRILPTKQERLMEKRMNRGELLDTNTRINHIRKLLESSDDEEEIRANCRKKSGKRKQLKRLKNKKRKAGKKRR